MKKTLVAMASVAALGAMSTAAMAQSSMTIYGNLDQQFVGASQNGKSIQTSGSNADGASYWGIKSNEDLGGGLNAFFDLRSEITLMTGKSAATSTTTALNGNTVAGAAPTSLDAANAQMNPDFWNRAAYIGVGSTSFGTLKIGRSDNLWWASQGEVNTNSSASFGFGNLTSYQNNVTSWKNLSGGATPTNLGYMSTTPGSTSAVAAVNPGMQGDSNTFVGGYSYKTPSFSGFSAGYQFGNPKQSYNAGGSVNNISSYTLNYDGNGAVVRLANSTQNDNTGSKAWEVNVIGATYTMGQWKFAVAQNKLKMSGTTALANNGSTATGLGVTYSVSSALELNANYGTLQDDVVSANKATQTGLMARYKLSPRTTLVAGAGTATNKGNSVVSPIYGGWAPTDAAVGGVANNNSAYMLGVKHTF